MHEFALRSGWFDCLCLWREFSLACFLSFVTGRGTSMLDGLSIAWSVIEHLHSAINCRTLASTHYHQLAKLAEILPHVDCYHVTAKNERDGISFTFKVIVSTLICTPESDSAKSMHVT